MCSFEMIGFYEKNLYESNDLLWAGLTCML